MAAHERAPYVRLHSGTHRQRGTPRRERQQRRRAASPVLTHRSIRRWHSSRRPTRYVALARRVGTPRRRALVIPGAARHPARSGVPDSPPSLVAIRADPSAAPRKGLPPVHWGGVRPLRWRGPHLVPLGAAFRVAGCPPARPKVDHRWPPAPLGGGSFPAVTTTRRCGPGTFRPNVSPPPLSQRIARRTPPRGCALLP